MLNRQRKGKPGFFDSIKIKVDEGFDTVFDVGDIVSNMVRGTDEYRDTGSTGERYTYNILRDLFPNRHIFRNVYITKADGRLTEIDLLAINTKGIFVFESKNYSGWIFGNSKDRYWTVTLPNGLKNRFYSPIRQNASHIEALKETFCEKHPDITYHSLIVFSKRCELKKVDYKESGAFVFERQELRFYIKQIMKVTSLGVLSEKEVEDIALWLKSCERPDEMVKQQHLRQLEEAAHTCPWCGSELVERHNRKTGSVFMGCSTFPQCRYTAERRT
jgi:ssDNA-binding Zn-finger/Zn-ribbon topoisomerase 1